MNFAVVRAIASQELTLALRNRWVLLFGLIFGVASLDISFFGMVTAGYAGFQDFQRTTASLLNLNLYLVPLLALMMGTFSLVSHREHIELLLAQPVRRSDWLVGKIGGLTMALLLVLAVGLGLPGVVFSLSVGTAGLGQYLVLIAGTVTLGTIFLGLAGLLSVITHRRLVAVGAALLIWFVFVIFYDLVVLGSTSILPARAIKPVILASLLGNPVDVVRVAVLTAVGGAEIFGPAGRVLSALIEKPFLMVLILLGVLTVWLIFPVWLAGRIFRNQDI